MESSVPVTIIGSDYIIGYNEEIKNKIENMIDAYSSEKHCDVVELIIENKDISECLSINEGIYSESDEKVISLFGKKIKFNAKNVSLPIISLLIGFIDGFNPCAMWVLIFLISMLFNMKNKKRMWILGITFLVTSAFVYFLAMLGLNVVLSFTAVKWVRSLIGAVALVGGLVNINSYINTKDDGCHIVDDSKRKKYFTKIKEFTSEQNFILALIGVITLAASVNLVELACSAGFPAIFIEILNINNFSNLQDTIYILIYILFFLIDDLVIFFIAMTTLKLTGISTKYNKLSHLIGGILMILMGILLILKPEWLMFNF